MKTHSEIASEIIENLIEYDGWRDNLHVNDFPYTRMSITNSLDSLAKEKDERIKELECINAAANKVFGADCDGLQKTIAALTKVLEEAKEALNNFLYSTQNLMAYEKSREVVDSINQLLGKEGV